jgi:hypothetical protein
VLGFDRQVLAMRHGHLRKARYELAARYGSSICIRRFARIGGEAELRPQHQALASASPNSCARTAAT